MMFNKKKEPKGTQEEPNIDESEVKNITDYALMLIEEKPEAFTNLVDSEGIGKAIPTFISTVMTKILQDKPSINLDTAVAGTVGLWGILSKMVSESQGGKQLDKEEMLPILTESIKIVIALSPKLSSEAEKKMLDDGGVPLDPDGNPVDPDNPPVPREQIVQEEQGVI